MKTELEKEDIQAIAREVVERINALLANKGKDEEDTVFNVPRLAEYLRVDKSWVYKQVSLKTIPYFKTGKYTKFKKSVIDKWIEKKTINPIPPLRLVHNNR